MENKVSPFYFLSNSNKNGSFIKTQAEPLNPQVHEMGLTQLEYESKAH